MRSRCGPEGCTLTGIAHVTGRYPPHLGGVEVVVRELARRQVAAGHVVRVITSAPDDDSVGVTWEDGVEVDRRPTRVVGNTPIIAGLRPALTRGGFRPAVVHVHGTYAGLAEQVTSACATLGVPYVAHLHLVVRPSSPAGEILLRPYQSLLYRRHLRRASRVICLTASMAVEVSRRYRLDSARVAVVGNGAPAVCRGDGAARHPDRLLFAGRLTAQKGILPLVEAMAGLPGLHLDVLGDGDQAPDARAVAARNPHANVHFHGRQSPEVLAAAYRAATALVMPSSHEGFPLVMLEAMAAGTPVVAAAIPEIVEVAGDAIWPIDEITPAGISRAVHGVLAAPGRLGRLSAAGTDVASRYSWDAVVAAVDRIYRSVGESSGYGAAAPCHAG